MDELEKSVAAGRDEGLSAAEANQAAGDRGAEWAALASVLAAAGAARAAAVQADVDG